MKSNLLTRTPGTDLRACAPFVVRVSPKTWMQGTSVPVAADAAASAADVQVAFGARTASLTGLPPRDAPV